MIVIMQIINYYQIRMISDNSSSSEKNRPMEDAL